MAEHKIMPQWVDDAARATRVTVVDASGESGGALPDPVERATTATRVATAATTAIAAGARSYSVTVLAAASAASPTLDGVAIPVGMTVRRVAPNNDTLEAASVVTVSGDDVLIDEVR
jgi:hypothetical protein